MMGWWLMCKNMKKAIFAMMHFVPSKISSLSIIEGSISRQKKWVPTSIILATHSSLENGLKKPKVVTFQGKKFSSRMWCLLGFIDGHRIDTYLFNSSATMGRSVFHKHFDGIIFWFFFYIFFLFKYRHSLSKIMLRRTLFLQFKL